MSDWNDSVTEPINTTRAAAPGRAQTAQNGTAEPEPLTNENEVERLVGLCLEASTLAHTGRYDTDQASRTAAMFLSAQIRLTLFISDIELRARDSKNEIQRVEADKYFQLKSNATGKVTEGALAQSVAIEKDVIAAKKACAAAEAEAKKWNYLLGVLKDGHIFFRGLNKTNNI